jgi:hypothetical protein
MKDWELQVNANFGVLTNESPKPCHKNPKQKSSKFNKKIKKLKLNFKNQSNEPQISI